MRKPLCEHMYQGVFKSTIGLGRNKQLCRLFDRGGLFTKIERRLQTPFATRTNYFHQRPAGFEIDSETAEKAGNSLPRCSWPDRGCRELRERRGKTPC